MSGRNARLWALGALAAGAIWIALTVVASPPRTGDRKRDDPAAEATATLASAGPSGGRVQIHAGPAGAADENDLGLREPRAGNGEIEDAESAHHAAFVALLGGDETLDAAAILRADGPTYRKVALLRALLDTGSPAVAEACALAIAELPLESDERGVSVPEFAVRLLGENAAGRPELQAVLHAAVWGPARVRDPGLRARAAKALVAAAEPAELQRVARELRVDPDPDLLRIASSALTDGTIAPTMAYLFADLALPPPASAEERE